MFNNVSPSEFDQLTEAIALITVYIAGADGTIDQEEKDWATKLTKIRSFASDELLNEYYAEVGKDYAEKLDHYIDTLGDDTAVRNATIAEKLTALNPILANMENLYGAHLYKSYVTFAEHVAKASGGFLGFGSINAAENKLIGLDMINSIELIVEDEE